jgi:hypothetical protein
VRLQPVETRQSERENFVLVVVVVVVVLVLERVY